MESGDRGAEAGRLARYRACVDEDVSTRGNRSGDGEHGRNGVVPDPDSQRDVHRGAERHRSCRAEAGRVCEVADDELVVQRAAEHGREPRTPRMFTSRAAMIGPLSGGSAVTDVMAVNRTPSPVRQQDVNEDGERHTAHSRNPGPGLSAASSRPDTRSSARTTGRQPQSHISPVPSSPTA